MNTRKLSTYIRICVCVRVRVRISACVCVSGFAYDRGYLRSCLNAGALKQYQAQIGWQEQERHWSVENNFTISRRVVQLVNTCICSPSTLRAPYCLPLNGMSSVCCRSVWYSLLHWFFLLSAVSILHNLFLFPSLLLYLPSTAHSFRHCGTVFKWAKVFFPHKPERNERTKHQATPFLHSTQPELRKQAGKKCDTQIFTTRELLCTNCTASGVYVCVTRKWNEKKRLLGHLSPPPIVDTDLEFSSTALFVEIILIKPNIFRHLHQRDHELCMKMFASKN